MKSSDDDWQSLQTTPTPVGGVLRGRPGVRVICDGKVAVYPLPRLGDVVIGRGLESQICINHTSVSRVHAVLHVGKALLIEDLGSSNGTRVRDSVLKPNEPIEVFPNEVIDVGVAMLLVEGVASREYLRRFCTQEYLELRCDEEIARATRANSEFAVAHLEIESGQPASLVQTTVGGSLRPYDLIAPYGNNHYAILLADCPADRATVIVRRAVRTLEARGSEIRSGVACFPHDGRHASELLAAARRAVRNERAAVETESGLDLVIEDPVVQRIYRLIERVADTMLNVLLLGETGVGKEVLAERLHACSKRAAKPLVKLNCAALPEPLLESELFGHEAGAFTGATKRKIGLLASANGGTVFLDEISEMPPSAQAKLLRVLEDRKVLPLGSTRSTTIDVRFVAATNLDLEAEVERGRFRKDLYFRLDGISITIPPLRDRRVEIRPMALALLRSLGESSGRAVPEIDPEAMALIESYAWPGNIRELRNVLTRALALCHDVITLSHLPTEKMAPPPLSARSPQPPFDADTAALHDAELQRLTPTAGGPLRSEIDHLEQQRILDAIDSCAGNQTKAAETLGISRSTLLRRLARYKVPRPRGGDA